MAMNMDALLRIKADVQGANKIVELNRGLMTMGNTAKVTTNAMRGMTGAAAGLSGALGALAPLASVAGLVGLAKGALDAGDKLHDLAQSTGVSVEALARFKKAASVSGTDIDAVGKALVKLSKSMLEASSGSKQQAGAFKALGINVKDSNGQLKSADAVMLEVADRFKQMPDGVAKTALSLKLFGRAGAEMIPMLDMGGQAIDKLSVKMTTAFAEKADAYKDKLAMLSGKVGALGADLLIALLPALDAVTNAVMAGVSAFNSLSGPVKGVAISGAMLAIAWGPITGIVTGASAAFVAGTAAVQTLRVQIALAAMQDIPALSAAIMLIPGWGWALAGVAALTALSVALYQNSSDFRTWSKNIGSVVVDDFKNAMQAIVISGKSAFEKIIGSMKGFNQASVGIASGVGSAFGRMFGWIANQARSAFANVTNTIAGWWNSLPAPVRGALQKAGNFAGAAAQLVAFGPVGALANRENTRALQKKTNAQPKAVVPSAFTGGGYSPDLGALSGGAAGGKGGGGGADKAAADAKRLAEERAKQLLASQKALAISQAELTITQSTNALEKAAAEYALQKLRIEQDFAVKLADTKQLKDGQVKQEIVSNLEAVKRNELERARIGYLEQQTKELMRQIGIDNPEFGKKPTGFEWNDTTKYKPSPGTGLQGENAQKIDEEYKKIEQRLKDLANPANQIIGAANAIGDAFANSFEGMISGAMTAKDALRAFFQDIASYFTKMATQLIADAIRMAAIKLLTNLLGSALGGLGGGGGNFSPAGAGSTGISWTDAIKFTPQKFAQGGYVTGPTNAIVGEGGQPEYVIPASKMRESMGRYAAGARGSAVIGSGTGGGDVGGGTATATGSSIDVRYTVERINSVDYVTASQFQQGMQKAAMEGAQRGQQATLRRLQNSSSTRRSVGI
jgi:hypothetical protein